MTLVDTSVWVDHFRRGNRELVALLESGAVLCHPFIVGELACGTIKNRNEILSLLDALPSAVPASDLEARDFIERRRLFGSGLSWVDVHLCASAVLTPTSLWTLDKRLMNAADQMGIPRLRER